MEAPGVTTAQAAGQSHDCGLRSALTGVLGGTLGQLRNSRALEIIYIWILFLKDRS